jgi:glycosyltransferase involved in cell wall biosynthesis
MLTANRHKYIELALDCFESQTWDNKLLLILDNGTEPVEDLLNQRYATRRADSAIEYYRYNSNPHLTHGSLMNTCASYAAPGDILFAWDDDDWSAPERMQDEITRLIENKSEVTGYQEILFYNMKDGKTYKYHYTGPGMYATGTSQCFTYDWWKDNPFPEKPRGADGDFSRRAYEAGKLITVPGVGMMVARSHADSTCPPPLGQGQFPGYSRELFPPRFFEDIKRYE